MCDPRGVAYLPSAVIGIFRSYAVWVTPFALGVIAGARPGYASRCSHGFLDRSALVRTYRLSRGRRGRTFCVFQEAL